MHWIDINGCVSFDNNPLFVFLIDNTPTVERTSHFILEVIIDNNDLQTKATGTISIYYKKGKNANNKRKNIENNTLIEMTKEITEYSWNISVDPSEGKIGDTVELLLNCFEYNVSPNHIMWGEFWYPLQITENVPLLIKMGVPRYEFPENSDCKVPVALMFNESVVSNIASFTYIVEPKARAEPIDETESEDENNCGTQGINDSEVEV